MEATKARLWLTDNGFEIDTWTDFETNLDRPDGLLERATEFKSDWVIWDPYDDKEGYLLVGADLDALALEAWRHLAD